MSEPGEDIWRKRFQLFAAVRLIGVATFLLGIAVALSDLVRPGGRPLIGGLITLAGAIDAVFAPKLLRKLWRQRDAAVGDGGDGPNGA